MQKDGQKKGNFVIRRGRKTISGDEEFEMREKEDVVLTDSDSLGSDDQMEAIRQVSRLG